MYSKNKSMHSGSYHNLTPPPGYDGNRLFTRHERSDGRDENFVVHTRPIYRGEDREKEIRRNKEPVYADVVCENCENAPADPFPPFPGVEAFLDEPEEFWEGEVPDTEPAPVQSTCNSQSEESTTCKSSPGLPEPLAKLLGGLEREDLLLIGLLILLSADKSMSAGDILLLLALLLITK